MSSGVEQSSSDLQNNEGQSGDNLYTTSPNHDLYLHFLKIGEIGSNLTEEAKAFNQCSPKAKLDYVTLNNGAKIPIVGLGTWQSPPGEVKEAVINAIDCGYRHLDCAYVYRNEEEVGNGIKQAIKAGKVRREELFITSKCWLTFFSEERVEKCCRLSLSKLQLDYLDLYLVHWPIPLKEDDDNIYPVDDQGKVVFSNVDITETWRGMERCVELGLVRSIGVSNFNSQQIERILKVAKIKPVTNQVECHPYLNQKKLIDFCHERGIRVTAYSPLGSWPRKMTELDPPLLRQNPTVQHIASKHNKTPAQVLIKYQIQREVIAIPKSVNKQRIAENIAVFDFELSDEDMRALNDLNQNFRYQKFDKFGLTEYFDHPFRVEF
ncbi:aldose reductase-like protein [Dinothrombium tinctorium]|uniref:Aldose reductase-like protein n=2 Tax=Dinothrombium tinctorium TaxID=1965070 RepID=A0A3S3NT08_9ACAR|nr:aldose reductase-like protein [Dinothrombium tinctorium]RWS05650.1 aldose reductase-like protein [Dinothrombium tinctorium]